MNGEPNRPKSERARKAAALREAEAARERRRKIAIGAAAVLLAGGLAAGLTAVVDSGGSSSSRPVAMQIQGVETFAVASRTHVEGAVQYPQNPPVGGDHNPVWLNCGIYDTPVPNENAVHDLEHGAVWITYRPDLPAEQVEALKAFVRGQTFVDLSPYPGLPAPVVASAWGVQLKLDSGFDPRLPEFVDAYRQGPQTPEPGAPCTGGVGTPTG
ncbi:DUF3105 domain-containing protein [Yinghuangia sp. YIM S10712]|uniref:DUF3105 domain-containing protein n=1 Tax=Yinghuangia sp. YIM S10712 TaxID=3436930 RepID=UPI003F53964E